jgi:hypothetical protein
MDRGWIDSMSDNEMRLDARGSCRSSVVGCVKAHRWLENDAMICQAPTPDWVKKILMQKLKDDLAKTGGRSCRECAANLDVRHLACHGFSMHIPYLVHHCRWNTAGSLSRGILTVVDESIEVRERWTRGDTEHDIGRFEPSMWHNTLRFVSMWIVLLMIRSKDLSWDVN